MESLVGIIIIFMIIGIIVAIINKFLVELTTGSGIKTTTYNIILSAYDLGKTYTIEDREYYIPETVSYGMILPSQSSDRYRLKIIGIIENIKSLKSALNYIKSLDTTDRYIMFSELDPILTQYKDNYKYIESIKRNHSSYNFISEKTENIVNIFIDTLKNAEKTRKENNEIYVGNGLKKYKTFFDSLEGYGLELKQREAVLHDEDNNLVVAGAGTGKTTTIVGKVLHLVQNQNISPESILLLSYSKNAVKELRDRFSKHNIEKLNIKTFHALGKRIINNGQTVLDPENNEKETIIKEIFNKDILSNTKLSEKVTIFFAYYLKDIQTSDDFFGKDDKKNLDAKEKLKKYFEYLKSNQGRFIALDGKIVKSPDELIIANFLCLHSIKYEYEATYKDRQSKVVYNRGYKPDFYLPDYDIYIEHFSIYKDMETSYYGDDYVNRYYDKAKRHIINNTKLIETYSFEFKNKKPQDINILIEEKLKNAGIKIGKINYESVVKGLVSNNKEYKLFIPLVSTFIGLFKSNNLSFNELKDTYTDVRNQAFLEIFKIVIKEYQEKLKHENKIDFDDMIGSAVKALKNNQYKSNFEYILVDEFQDISYGRYQLLKELRNLNSGCRLFCVGDDWQSIYRFAGSDVSIFTNFSKDIGYTKETKLEKCWRLPININNASSEFILKNPIQIKKKLICNKEPKYIGILYLNSQETIDGIHKILEKHKGESTLILARYNLQLPKDINETSNLNIMSIHKSKGLEAENTILIINNSNHPYTFPSDISSDPVLDMVLSIKREEISYAEERRLFYVALTRTKENLYILSDKNSSNTFLDELKEMKNINLKIFGDNIEDKNISKWNCPKCGGKLIPRKNKNTGESFYGCEYYHYGCISRK